MSDLVHVKGLAELGKVMEELPVKIERNVLRGALRAGAGPIRTDARARAPVGPTSSENARIYGGYPGALRDSIRVTTKTRGGKVIASVVAGGKGKNGADVYYAHFVEFGTSPHSIVPQTRRALSIGGLFVESVEHPGARPQPFMRPALDGQAQQAVIAAAEYMKARLATKHGLDTAHINIEGDQ